MTSGNRFALTVHCWSWPLVCTAGRKFSFAVHRLRSIDVGYIGQHKSVREESIYACCALPIVLINMSTFIMDRYVQGWLIFVNKSTSVKKWFIIVPCAPSMLLGNMSVYEKLICTADHVSEAELWLWYRSKLVRRYIKIDLDSLAAHCRKIKKLIEVWYQNERDTETNTDYI